MQLNAKKLFQKSDYVLISIICKKKTIKYLGNVMYNLYLLCEKARWEEKVLKRLFKKDLASI